MTRIGKVFLGFLLGLGIALAVPWGFSMVYDSPFPSNIIAVLLGLGVVLWYRKREPSFALGILISIISFVVISTLVLIWSFGWH